MQPRRFASFPPLFSWEIIMSRGYLLLLLLFYACAPEGNPLGVQDQPLVQYSKQQPVPVSVTITPAYAEIPVKGVVQFTATVRDEQGNALRTKVQWSTGDPSIATIVNSGVARGRVAGCTDVVASAGGITGTAQLKVTSVGVGCVGEIIE